MTIHPTTPPYSQPPLKLNQTPHPRPYTHPRPAKRSPQDPRCPMHLGKWRDGIDANVRTFEPKKRQADPRSSPIGQCRFGRWQG